VAQTILLRQLSALTAPTKKIDVFRRYQVSNMPNNGTFEVRKADYLDARPYSFN
jgi:hypothetical protein